MNLLFKSYVPSY